jgi:hypothetical protein
METMLVIAHRGATMGTMTKAMATIKIVISLILLIVLIAHRGAMMTIKIVISLILGIFQSVK